MRRCVRYGVPFVGGVFDPRGFDLNRVNREWRGAMGTGRSR
jgi:hypothetical protein